jgi:repressor LexA
MDNKNIFATNLKKLMDLNKKSRKDISEALGISYYTVTDWVKGKKYPRMDKVEMLAQYFGVLKSDLIEEKSPGAEENTPRDSERKKKNEEIYNIFGSLNPSNTELAIQGLKYLVNLPEDKLPEAVRYLEFLATSARN